MSRTYYANDDGLVKVVEANPDGTGNVCTIVAFCPSPQHAGYIAKALEGFRDRESLGPAWKCPICHFPDSDVIDSRKDKMGYRRTRQCKQCRCRFGTREIATRIIRYPMEDPPPDC